MAIGQVSDEPLMSLIRRLGSRRERSEGAEDARHSADSSAAPADARYAHAVRADAIVTTAADISSSAAVPTRQSPPAEARDGFTRRRFVAGGLLTGAAMLVPAAAAAKADAATSSLEVTNEILWCTDPRVGLDPTSTADQTAQLQAMADLLCQSPAQYDRVGYLIPGYYRKTAPITFNNTNPFKLFGQGSKESDQAPTVVKDMQDCGAGTYAFNVGGSAPFHIEGISLIGSQDPVPKGSTVWLMRGLALPGYCTVRDFSADGYFAGAAILGSYILIEDFAVQGNTYGIDFGPNTVAETQVVLKRGRAGGCYIAAFGVASSGMMSGLRSEDVEGSTSPYVIKRYDDGTGNTVTNWIDGVEFINVATEYTGNAIVCNTIDTAGISNVIFDHGDSGNWGLYSTYVDPNGPQAAAWYSKGPISDVTFPKSLPSYTATQPAVLAPSIFRVTTPVAVGMNIPLTNGKYPFALSGSADGSQLVGTACGDGRGYRTLVVPFVASSAVRPGYCLTPTDSYNIGPYAGAGRVVGIAGHAASSGSVVHAFLNGNELSVLNTSGQTIPANALLVPDPAGGVAAGSYGSGQVIGRAFSAISAGQLGPAELHI